MPRMLTLIKCKSNLKYTEFIPVLPLNVKLKKIVYIKPDSYGRLFF